MHELFYGTGVKSISQNIYDYFTAISFVFLIIDDGMKFNEVLKLCTNSFQY